VRPTRAVLQTNLDPAAFVSAPNGAFVQFCGRPALVFNGTSLPQYIDTVGINTTAGSFIQFDLCTSCGVAGSGTNTVELQMVDNYGATTTPIGVYLSSVSTPWRALATQCNMLTNSSCRAWAGTSTPFFFNNAWTFTGNSVLLSADYGADYFGLSSWTRVVFPLSPSSQPGRRYRIAGTGLFAISNLYIGAECPLACGGRGNCVNGACVCDAGATRVGATCLPLSAPTELSESFDGPILNTRWSVISGATLSSVIVVGAQRALSFGLGVTRRLVTVDLDLREASFVEFLIYQENTIGTNFIFVSFSTDAGATWQSVGSTNTAVSTTQMYVFPLPPAARVLGCRIQWWQPLYDLGSDLWVRLGCVDI
jgi:hypothetical protein